MSSQDNGTQRFKGSLRFSLTAEGHHLGDKGFLLSGEWKLGRGWKSCSGYVLQVRDSTPHQSLESHSPSLWILSHTPLTVYTHSLALLLAWETSHLLAHSYRQRACLGTLLASLMERATDSICP